MSKVWGVYRARLERNLSQGDVSKLLRLHKDTYGRKERGELDFTISEAIKLSKHFGLSLDTLFLDNSMQEVKSS